MCLGTGPLTLVSKMFRVFIITAISIISIVVVDVVVVVIVVVVVVDVSMDDGQWDIISQRHQVSVQQYLLHATRQQLLQRGHGTRTHLAKQSKGYVCMSRHGK